MKYYAAVMFEETDQLVDIARAAEAEGFTGVALADHVAVPAGFASVHPSGENPFDHTSPFADPLITAAAMLSATTSLEVLTYVYILPMREPFSVASQVATLSLISNSRLRLGIGVGWLREEIELLGADPRTRGRRTDEMIEICRRFWRDGTAEFHGEFFDFGPTGMYPQPDAPISIWVGGKSEAALARAVRNDGWVGMNYDLPEIHQLLDRLGELRKEAGKEDGPFETMVIPNADPSPRLHDKMNEHGVTSTIAMPWYPGDPVCASIEAKRDALGRFADAFIRH
ncbi:TIGR03619 family F420-dependent LLM class oxidoreductase [Candidatus Poriferisocius sp.]|uniref:TIGR03619 family F420-dependent LLM class oxidoreductase n=1 Tax=Candidatus Poriferisocius sp. TaxID=3101276 RepID=UPI003B5ADF10